MMNDEFPPCGHGRLQAPFSGGPVQLACPLCLLPFAFCLLIFLCACGYHVAGRGDRLPPDVKTIAVPIFANSTSGLLCVSSPCTEAPPRPGRA
ncbi:MAG: hypothetical protein LAO07_17930, partial [Acidobacteriia bacterium]|nr:hypothetical protein [Terriglobia bacterium]